MKIFATIAVAALGIAFNASAAQVIVHCGSASYNYGIGDSTHPVGPAALNPGTIVCPGQVNLSSFSANIYVYFETDYQTGLATTPSNSAATGFAFTNSGATPVLLITGFGSSNQPSAVAVGAALGPNNPFIGGGFANYYDELLSDTNGADGQTVSYSNGANGQVVNGVATTGDVTSSSLDVYIVYNYTTGTPEPVSMVLFGSGLLAVSLIGRKKFARK